MGHFLINLPNNVKGEVRYGKVIKKEKRLLDIFLPWKKLNHEEKTGYIVKIEPAIEKTTEFRFFKTKEGDWSQDADGIIKIESETALRIRKAIEEHEIGK